MWGVNLARQTTTSDIELQLQDENQNLEIENLKQEINELRSRLNQGKVFPQIQMVKDCFQILPNPVEQESKIVYKINNTIGKAMFIIYDLQGKMLKQMDLPKSTKEGQLLLNKRDLSKGMYIL